MPREVLGNVKNNKVREGVKEDTEERKRRRPRTETERRTKTDKSEERGS